MLTTKRDPLENFEAQFKKSTLPMMVLKILSEEEKMYAYEITRKALHRSNGKYKMPLLYTTLNKLQEQGFVTEVEKSFLMQTEFVFITVLQKTGKHI